MLELSLLLRMHGNGGVVSMLSACTSTSIADAMYSLVLSVNACCSAGESWYLHPILDCGQNSPIPHSEESEKVVIVGFRNMTLLIDIPVFADSKNSSHKSRSSRVRLDSFTLVFRRAIDSFRRRLFMKCRASGMMKHTWLSLPIRVDISLYVTVRFALICLMFVDHAIHLSGGECYCEAM